MKRAWVEGFKKFGIPTLIFWLITFCFSVLLWGVYQAKELSALVAIIAIGFSSLSLTATVGLWLVVAARLLSTHKVQVMDLKTAIRAGKPEMGPLETRPKRNAKVRIEDPLADTEELEDEAVKKAEEITGALFGAGRENLNDSLLR